MSAGESDLQRVLADERDVFDAQLVGRETCQSRQASWCASFAATFGARARPTQTLARVRGMVAALPVNLHHLALAVDVNSERVRVGDSQVVSASGPR